MASPLTTARYARPQAGARAPWPWAACGLLLGALLACIAFAPARWLAWGLAQTSGERVQVLQAQGTVWHGAGQLVLGAGAQAGTPTTALPGSVQWQLRPSLHGLALTLQAPCCLSSPWTWTAQATTQGLHLRATDLPSGQALRLPSALLAGLGSPWNTLQLQGTLALQTQALALKWNAGALHLQGQLQLDALDMRTSLSPLRPVGSYRLQLHAPADASPAQLTLSTLEGALQLQGSGQWHPGRLQLDGEARAAPGHEDALANLLNILGRRDGARSILHVG